jgi:hypothetical protein
VTVAEGPRDQGPPPPAERSSSEAMADYRSLELLVDRLTIGSPMDITLAVGGATGAGSMALFGVQLFARALRQPGLIGGWLPSVLTGWHKEMYEVEKQKAKRNRRKRQEWLESDEVAELVKATKRLETLGLQPSRIAILGLSEAEEESKRIGEIPGQRDD